MIYPQTALGINQIVILFQKMSKAEDWTLPIVILLVVLCVAAIVLNILVIKKHFPKRETTAALLFITLSVLNICKSLLGITYEVYGLLKNGIGYFDQDNKLEKYLWAGTTLLVKCTFFITTLLNIHRFITVKWRNFIMKRRFYLAAILVYFAFLISLSVCMYYSFDDIISENTNSSVPENKSQKSSEVIAIYVTTYTLDGICDLTVIVLSGLTVKILYKQVQKTGNAQIKNGAITIILLSVTTAILLTFWLILSMQLIQASRTDLDKSTKLILIACIPFIVVIESIISPAILLWRTRDRQLAADTSNSFNRTIRNKAVGSNDKSTRA